MSNACEDTPSTPPDQRAKLEPSLGRVTFALDACLRNPFRLIYRPDAGGVDGGAYVKFSCDVSDQSCSCVTFSKAGCSGDGTKLENFVSSLADSTCRPLPSAKRVGLDGGSVTFVKSTLVPYSHAAENLTTPYSVVYGQDGCLGEPVVLMETPSLSVCKSGLNKQGVISSSNYVCGKAKSNIEKCHYETADCSGGKRTCEAASDDISAVGVCSSSTFGDKDFRATQYSCDKSAEPGGGISFASVCILLLFLVIFVLLVVGYRKYNEYQNDYGGGSDFSRLTDNVGSYS